MSARPWSPATAASGADYSAIELAADGARAFVLDQLRLPTEEVYLEARSVAEVADAIRRMVVRGAPAIGVAAAYGMTLAAREARALRSDEYVVAMERAGALLVATRPTAVNLAWAVERCLDLARAHADSAGASRHLAVADEARRIHCEDVACCRAMGRHGAERLATHARDGVLRVLTHCNAGALATGGYGTALGVIRGLVGLGLEVKVLADETRPYLQGARLTAWELARDGIDVTVLGDGMAAHCMRRGMVDVVVVGADRIARNGDVANKIGTYGVACLARAHQLPFYVAAPSSTLDPRTATGAEIAIEERPREELARLGDRTLVPDGVAVYNPGFDVTPHELVTAIVTERGVFAPSRVVPSGA